MFLMTCSIFRKATNLCKQKHIWIQVFCCEFQLVLHVVIGLLLGTCEQIGPKASNRGRLSGNIQRFHETVLK